MDTMLLTGANRGLGLEWVRQLDQAGWRVLACCRNPAKAAELNAIAAKSKGRVTVHKLDVTHHGQVDKLAHELRDVPIDVLNNNAGVLPTRDRWGETDYHKWQELIWTNLFSTCKVSEAFTPHVAKSRRKIILTMASTLSSVSMPGGGPLVWGDEKHVYRTTKAGINMLAKSMSGYLKPMGIIVVSINPGWANTEMGRQDLEPDQTTDILLDPVVSIRSMRQLIDKLTLNETGNLYKWNGEELPP
ncbi:MAG: SDR family oxidoreductase [Alphaproteobacteria bacterium]|nr:SDR family oxidoreductase [Alphaproteobacteria bacterium]